VAAERRHAPSPRPSGAPPPWPQLTAAARRRWLPIHRAARSNRDADVVAVLLAASHGAGHNSCAVQVRHAVQREEERWGQGGRGREKKRGSSRMGHRVRVRTAVPEDAR
jgi:hypothetical protein